MTPQYKSLKVNKLNEYNKGDNNALLHMAAKAQRSKPTHAATSAMPPLCEIKNRNGLSLFGYDFGRMDLKKPSKCPVAPATVYPTPDT